MTQGEKRWDTTDPKSQFVGLLPPPIEADFKPIFDGTKNGRQVINAGIAFRRQHSVHALSWFMRQTPPVALAPVKNIFQKKWRFLAASPVSP